MWFIGSVLSPGLRCLHEKNDSRAILTTFCKGEDLLFKNAWIPVKEVPFLQMLTDTRVDYNKSKTKWDMIIILNQNQMKSTLQPRFSKDVSLLKVLRIFKIQTPIHILQCGKDGSIDTARKRRISRMLLIKLFVIKWQEESRWKELN